jgi:hypothetical protein
MVAKIRAKAVSASKFSAAVDRAVKIAADRHDVAVSDTTLIANWELIGRILRASEMAHRFSSDVASQVSKEVGLPLTPATYQIGRQILCGFIERGRLPITRDLI